MMVHVNFSLNSVQKTVHLTQRGALECLVARVLIGKPIFPGRKTGRPFHILALGIKIVLRAGKRKFISKSFQIDPQNSTGNVQSFAGVLMIHDPFHPFILYTEKQTVGIACQAHETVFFTVIVSSKAFPLPVQAGRGTL